MKNEIDICLWPINGERKPRYYVSISTNSDLPACRMRDYPGTTEGYALAKQGLEEMLGRYHTQLDFTKAKIDVKGVEKRQEEEIRELIGRYARLEKLA